MSDTVNTSSPLTMPSAGMSLTTPTGLQSIAELTRRRRVVFALNVATYLAMLWVAARILGSGGWTVVDGILFVCFAFGTPWTVLGFWNSLIGLWLLHFRRNAMARGRALCDRRRREGAAAHQDGDLHDAAQRGRGAGHLALPYRQGQRRCDGRGRGVRLLRAERHQQPRRSPPPRRRRLRPGRRPIPIATASSTAAAPTTPATRPATCATSARAGAATTR